MEITEVRIKLMEESEDRLRAFCSITFDHCFVVRDLKIIDGVNGPFVAMPSRKLTGHCPRCKHKNHLRALYCNQCGVKLRSSQEAASESPQKLYADVAHPINSACRELIQNAVIEELETELARSGEPGYRSRYDDDFQDAGPESEGDESTNFGSQSPEDSAESRTPPPRPHFERSDKTVADEARGRSDPGRGESTRRERRQGESTQGEPERGEDDSFGAGVF